MNMRSIAALFTLIAGIGSASAAGLPTLNNVAKKAIVSEKVPGLNLRVRAPKNAHLAKYVDGGMMEGFTTVKAVKQTATGKVYDLAPGQYQYRGKNFIVQARFARNTAK